jgi:hypothetical protein
MTTESTTPALAAKEFPIPMVASNGDRPPLPKKTLRAWLEDNDVAPELTSEICPMRSLVAMGCTMRRYDPGLAGRTSMDRDEVEQLMREARDEHLRIINAHKPPLPEHHAPILTADGMLFAMVIKKPQPGQIEKINSTIFNAAVSQERDGMKLTMMSSMLATCTLFPDVGHVHKVFIEYGGLSQEFANKCMALGRQAVEEIVGK